MANLTYINTQDNRSEFLKFVIPSEQDGGLFLRMGHTTRGFFLNSLDNVDGSKLCLNKDHVPVAAFSLQTQDEAGVVKALQSQISKDSLQRMLDEMEKMAGDTFDTLQIQSVESAAWFVSLLTKLGFEKGEKVNALLVRDLSQPIPEADHLDGIQLRPYDPKDLQMRHSRMLAQSSAFNHKHVDTLGEWGMKNKDRMAEYCLDTNAKDLVALRADGTVTSAVGIDLDHANRIGEFEPVITAHRHKRKGHARALMLKGLSLMKAEGTRTAYVRTDANNTPAIKAYESVGFKIQEHSRVYSKPLK